MVGGEGVGSMLLNHHEGHEAHEERTPLSVLLRVLRGCLFALPDESLADV